LHKNNTTKNTDTLGAFLTAVIALLFTNLILIKLKTNTNNMDRWTDETFDKK